MGALDDPALVEWLESAEQSLLRTAYLITGDLHRAQDLVQEAMVKVAVRWERVRDGSPTASARRVIARDDISWWRRAGRGRVHVAPDAEVRADAVAASSDPETAMVVRAALLRLPRGQRAVVVLRHFDDLTERETARVLGVGVGTVKSQNAAALARLRADAPELAELVGGEANP